MGIGRIVLFAVLAFVIAVLTASEWGGEVVELRTTDGIGATQTTRLWIVDDQGNLWLRAGRASSGWLERVRVHPVVELVRGGTTAEYNASPVPEAAERINALMAEKYGVADWLIGLLRSRDDVVPVRLDRQVPR